MGDQRARHERKLALISDWTTLKCDCKGELFIPMVKLKWKADGGTTTEPAGHRCAACNAHVDNAYMIKLIDMQKKREEVTRLQASLAVDEATMKKPVMGQAPVGRN